MLKIVVVLSLILLGFVLGGYLGYQSGAKNQLHFDAVARASLLEKVLDSDDAQRKDFISGMLQKEKCLLSSDFNFSTFTANHPIHNDVLDYYKKNIERVCSNNSCKCGS